MNTNTTNQAARAKIARLLCTLTIAAAAGSAWAQDGGPDAGRGAPLGGPGVKDRGPPGERGFGEQQRGKGEGKFARRQAPYLAFIRAVAELNMGAGPEELQLSDEQAQQIRAIEGEFRAQVKAFREQHADELAALRKEAGLPERGEGRGEGRGPGPGEGRGEGRGKAKRGPGGEPNPQKAEVREKLRAIMEQAPKPDEFQTRQWAILNEKQQEFVKDRIARMREEGGPGPGAGEGPRRRPGGEDGAPGARRGERGPRGEAGPGGPRRGPDDQRGGPGRRGPRPDRGERPAPPPDGKDDPMMDAPPPPAPGENNE